MVGEIRDKETLFTATSASLTGHLVFATLHTNDAPSAITRMIQMGLPAYLIADSLIGVVTQRLVRKICPHCKKIHKPQQSILEDIKKYLPSDYTFYQGYGCERCNFTGYSGRIMINEILTIDNYLASLIALNTDKYKFYEEALQHGFEPMLIDGIYKALKGITTIEEVLRVVKI
jgi:general secretion pathway protein E/type IV pilus assembly protein PilB